MTTATVHNLADYKHAENFPPNLETGGNSASATGVGGNPQSSHFAGHSADSTSLKTAPAVGSGGKQKQPKGKGGTPTKTAPKSHTPTVARTPGPEGYKVDCAKVALKEWPLETLKAAYPSEAMSWKKSRERAPKLGMTWNPAWDKFNVFLLDMKPKPSPAHTLDRTDPAIKAYGPGLCRWLDKPGQNNNKTTNIKIYDPLTKTHFSSHQLATMHGVPVETIHKWKSAGWTPLELLIGKKDQLLVHIAAQAPNLFEPPALKVAIKDLPHDTPAPPKALRLPLTFLKYHKAPDLDCDDPCDYVFDEDTGKEIAGPLSAAFLEQVRRFKVLQAWYDAWNAGEPCTLYPPVKTNLTADMSPYVKPVNGKQWNPATPFPVAQPAAPAPAEPDEGDDEDDDDDPEAAAEEFAATACDEDFNEETGYEPPPEPAAPKKPGFSFYATSKAFITAQGLKK